MVLLLYSYFILLPSALNVDAMTGAAVTILQPLDIGSKNCRGTEITQSQNHQKHLLVL